MSTTNSPEPEIKLKPPPCMASPKTATLPDVENQKAPSQGPVSSIFNRWKREDLLQRGSLVLRAAALLLSLIGMAVMASNKHGDLMNFDKYEEYRYLLAVSILSCLYTAGQVGRQVHHLSSGNDVMPHELAGYVDFLGDQIVAYLLMSSLSAAAALTTNMRKSSDNVFTDASSATVSMAYFAFLSLAVSSSISGFKLSSRSYI